MRIQDFSVGVTLPYSGDCYERAVLSDTKRRIPKIQCDAIKARGLFITSQNWKVIRKNFQDNCQVMQCTQLVGQFDNLFLEIDKAFQKVPF